MKTLQIELDDSLNDMIRRMAEELNESPEQVIKIAIQKFLALSKVEEIRNRLANSAGQYGFKSEEQIFDEIS